MFSDKAKATKAALLAGYGSTMPMRIADINRGWEPEASDKPIIKIHSIVNRDVERSKIK